MNSETVADTHAFHALPVPDVAAQLDVVPHRRWGRCPGCGWLGAAVVAFAVVEADKLFWRRVAARRGTGPDREGGRR
ncbi:hypothetical protein ACIA5G_30705 [Amycolatopsis sp. NPDC051758]|uniref:hypothetical protein n=1 Tax=Amycolatopsis sp. NPDC051758 TaxID=3363935 RepID=UPI00378BFA19